MKKIYSALICLAFLSVSSSAQQIDFKEGMWQWSMTMEMMGMKMPPITYSDCMTQKELIPQQEQENENCKIIQQSITDNVVEWKIECPSEVGVTSSEGKIVYTDTTAQGEISVSSQGMSMKSTINGQYQGPCNK